MIVRVVKADGGVEEYLHTKVLLCISNALCAVGECDVVRAHQLAETVTAFVYSQRQESVRSGDILSMLKVVLAETGYDDAAGALSEYHHRRGLARRRTELVEAEVNEPADAEALRSASAEARQWSKGLVVEHVMKAYGLEKHAARAVAGRVEEKVLAMGMPKVWSGLVRQVIVAETALMLRAEAYLRQRGTDRGAKAEETMATVGAGA